MIHFFFRSLHPRSVRATSHVCRTDKIMMGAPSQLIRSLKVARNDSEVGYYVGIMVSD
jgi:hypothetical protein